MANRDDSNRAGRIVPGKGVRRSAAAGRLRRHESGTGRVAGAIRRASDAAAALPGAESPWVQLRSATYHPFIYQRMIACADRAARPGDVVNVYDKGGTFFGRGLFNPKSQIALRMLVWGQTPVDDTFWQKRIEQAVALRRALRLDETTDAYRLVHAEGDGLSGLVVERYADCLVFELFSLGMFQRREQLAGMIAASLGAPTRLDRPDRAAVAWQIHFRADREIEEYEGFRVPAPTAETESPMAALRGGHATPPSCDADGAPSCDAGDARIQNPNSKFQIPNSKIQNDVVIREHGVRYRVDVAAGQKTGFFCDQRDNRRRFAALCRDASVLDVCCYTGGFGLCAKLLGGAKEVTSVDLDESAVAVARENANLNQARIDVVHSDAFTYLRQMIAHGRRFDAVVLDPPKFATSRDVYEEALRKYCDLNTVAMQVVAPGGVLLTCSCSGLVSRDAFMNAIHAAGRRAGRQLQLFDLTGAGRDHPVMTNCPESAYLKAAWLRVL